MAQTEGGYLVPEVLGVVQTVILKHFKTDDFSFEIVYIRKAGLLSPCVFETAFQSALQAETFEQFECFGCERTFRLSQAIRRAALVQRARQSVARTFDLQCAPALAVPILNLVVLCARNKQLNLSSGYILLR